MPCYHPVTGYPSLIVNPSGKRSLVFDQARSLGAGVINTAIKVPCGRCIGCRLEYSRQWAVRCMHEAQTHEENCFITLTYDDDHLPSDLSLCLKDFQNFMKRLRKLVSPQKVRFFHCGEYGADFGRPHYHACLFGFDFEDKVLFKTRDDVRLYTSDVLQSLWTFGFSTIGDVTFDSAAYVARYVLKKVTGNKEDVLGHYQGRKPEYTTMSRRPGIGAAWLNRFSSDVYPSDELVSNGAIMKPPRFYDNQYESIHPDVIRSMKAKRCHRAQRPNVKINNTPERLEVRKKVKMAQFLNLKRDVDL